MPQWDPTTYLQFDDERSRPFVDLVGRIGAVDPHTIVDLGCGPGGQTASLQARWPEAMITGFDSSPEMIASAAEHASDQVSFAVQDLRDWRPETPVDVIISNATLQWIPEHRALLPQLVDSLTSQGWLAFQVPGNFDEPSHRLLRELAREPAYAEFTQTVEQPDSSDPEDYLADLTALGCAVDAWETTYLHVLTGPDAVFRWISGTGARPILQALPADLRNDFEAEYRARLNLAYPRLPFGTVPQPFVTVLPFRRVFVVASTPRRQE